MILLPNEFLKLLQQDSYTELFYGAGRDLVESVTGKEKNACAAVASSALMIWGVFKTPVFNTVDMERQLIATGLFEKFYDYREIRPANILFSEDDNNNNMPDHVYIAVGIPEDEQCLIFDNYKPIAHMRNLGAGRRTPFAYGYRFKESKKKLPPMARYLSRRAFNLLYYSSVWNRLPESAQHRINLARHHPIFM